MAGGLLIDEFIHRLGLAEMIDSTVKVKDLADTINVCMDSIFYDKEIVQECDRLNIGFSITADQTAPLMRAVNAIKKVNWIQIDDNVWVSEFEYKPIGIM